MWCNLNPKKFECETHKGCFVLKIPKASATHFMYYVKGYTQTQKGALKLCNDVVGWKNSSAYTDKYTDNEMKCSNMKIFHIKSSK